MAYLIESYAIPGVNFIRFAEEGNLELVKQYLEQGGDINYKTSTGASAISRASFYGELDIIEYLINNGANINSKDNTGWTPLMSASVNDYSAIVEFLIDKGAKIDARSNNGSTALTISADMGSFESVKILVKKEANLKLKTKAGKTALDYAKYNMENLKSSGKSIKFIKIFDYLKQAMLPPEFPDFLTENWKKDYK
jgi:ankyrin repeat protein